MAVVHAAVKSLVARSGRAYEHLEEAYLINGSQLYSELSNVPVVLEMVTESRGWVAIYNTEITLQAWQELLVTFCIL